MVITSAGARLLAARVTPSFVDPDLVVELFREKVHAANSCLFACINLLLCNGKCDLKDLRQAVADEILQNPDEFNELVLEKPPQEYADWILKPKSWGGYIELVILARLLRAQLWCIDVASGRIDKYGDEVTSQEYSDESTLFYGSRVSNQFLIPCRVFLVYTGMHYDAILGRLASGQVVSTFKIAEDMMAERAVELVRFLRRKDVIRPAPSDATVTVICDECNTRLLGRRELTDHAAATGHERYSALDV